jgi:2-C-methyl-D-erythritol 2,4-cyclodiphosphate synthase
MMTSRGYRIGNADLTIVAQKPKMAPHIIHMIEKLTTVLACDYDQINIKSTTSESLGFTGRGEGIACHASVLLESVSD